mgnify:CR=1 FL=1
MPDPVQGTGFVAEAIRLQAGDRHQPGVTRAAPDEHDPATSPATAPEVDRPRLDVQRERPRTTETPDATDG